MSPATAQQLPAVALRHITATHAVIGRITPEPRRDTGGHHAWTPVPTTDGPLPEIYRPTMPSAVQGGSSRIAIGPILAMLGALLLIGGLIMFRPKGQSEHAAKDDKAAAATANASDRPENYENACRRMERCCREQHASQFCGVVAAQNLTACDNAIKNTKETEGIECK